MPDEEKGTSREDFKPFFSAQELAFDFLLRYPTQPVVYWC
jgi:hypothetical protein